MSPWRAPCDTSVNDEAISIADEIDWNKENESYRSVEPKTARQNLMKSRHLFKRQSKLIESGMQPKLIDNIESDAGAFEFRVYKRFLQLAIG